jgi:hypothetical protein
MEKKIAALDSSFDALAELDQATQASDTPQTGALVVDRQDPIKKISGVAAYDTGSDAPVSAEKERAQMLDGQEEPASKTPPAKEENLRDFPLPSAPREIKQSVTNQTFFKPNVDDKKTALPRRGGRNQVRRRDPAFDYNGPSKRRGGFNQ